jgi:predicted GIY-YIG superfamily endonuclease
MDYEHLQVLRECAIANAKVSNLYKKMNRSYYNGNKYFTYALLLQNNKIYVGETFNIYSRLMTHFEMSESSAKWVRLHGPVKRILEITYDAPLGAENERTLEYADIFGYENVRGGYHCMLELSKPPLALETFKRGQMKHKFMQRDEIRQIELDIRTIVSEKIDNHDLTQN